MNFKLLSPFMLLLLLIQPLYPNMVMNKGEYRVKIFFSQNETAGIDAVLKGKVQAFSSKDEYDKQDLLNRAQEKSKVTVRLYSTRGVHEGDVLYIINDRNIVVAKVMAKIIFNSGSFGKMVIGYGFFRLASIGDRVVQLKEDSYTQYSCVYTARGDYYLEAGDTGNAISEYKKAIEMDSGNPEARIGLGKIYFKQGLYQFAFMQYEEAYKRIARIYDMENRYDLLRGMAEIRFHQLYYEGLPAGFRDRYMLDGVKYCAEALQANPDSVQVNYMLGVFYSRRQDPMDEKARDCFLKVIELDPMHAKACIALSELYFKHDNYEKARTYAEMALKAEPTNKRAFKLLKYIEGNTKGRRF
ncbi:MAG: tetratricopeptide repeat protein [Spirochaetes bacterium]|nr:tetratricopeptide repeat protein [Spirochaetota bacterium]